MRSNFRYEGKISKLTFHEGKISKLISDVNKFEKLDEDPTLYFTGCLGYRPLAPDPRPFKNFQPAQSSPT